MKKLLCLALSLVLCFTLVLTACGDDPSTDSSSPTQSSVEDEYKLERPEGYRQLTIYYNRSAGYDNCDIWMWYGSTPGRGYLFTTCPYGAKVVINVPEDVTEVGFIIRTGCSDPGGESWGSASKDGTDNDRFVTLTGDYTTIYTKAKDANSYTSEDGGVTLKIIKNIVLADMLDLTHIKVTMSDYSTVTKANSYILDGDGNKVAISSISGNKITTENELDVGKSYTMYVDEAEPVGIVPMTYFSSKAFGEQYTYNGQLGVELEDNSTTFRLWAPTASKVVLNLFNSGNGGSAYENIDMTLGEKGVWSHVANSNLNGKYYTYTVTTSMGTNEAVDPYAVSAGLNGLRGMILDLKTTNPDGWDGTPFVNDKIENYTDAQIWEVHVRDFSNRIASSQYKGKYLAFTERGLTNSNGVAVGVDYLVNLGITHVHLQPTFDFASVDEAANTDSNPSNDQFNWGYDPQNYNVPEGSYATDATDGAVRVNEFKQMVKALHDAGIGVVLDMVYNHTFSANSNLSKIVPYYYYRYSNGVLSNGSGCGNETASERPMMSKYMLDSVKYWQSEYNVDGFRFDLMGLHDLTTMQKIRDAVHEVNPRAIIYGEGWTGGTSTSTYTGATLTNLKKLNSDNPINGIAMFNDVVRDAIKGSVFDINETGFATGANRTMLGGVMFGVNGGVYSSALGTSGSWFADNPTQVINYCSAHDNNTLWDRICHVYGTAASSLEKRLARNRLSAAIVQTSLGVPFVLAGEEMLRSKVNADGSYNENSYNASDAVNNIDWEALTPNSDQLAMSEYYKGLIAFRKAHPVLRQTAAKDGSTYACNMVYKNGCFAMFTITHLVSGEQVLIVYNAEEREVSYQLPEGNWDLYINGTTAGINPITQGCSGNVSFAPISCYVFVKA